MALRVPFAADGRLHREEELTLARRASQLSDQGITRASTEPTPALGGRLDGTSQVPEPSPRPPSVLQRRRVIFPDPVAFWFLQEEACVTVVERRQELHGYELFLVEQWACTRESPTLVITAYTGNMKHSVMVGVLGIPVEEKDWSPRLRLYFKAMQQFHARPKETELGELMVTNLSSFPSALTVIAIPDGDIRKHRQVFIINEDLKRLGCSGRSGMTLSPPTPATQAKFLQMYRTSERIPFFEAVLELVKLCQVALFVFGKLEQEYMDGLLCDKTETAINNWWTEIGSEYYNVEPTDGILGPTTVAALLGTLMGARNRLNYCGAPMPKDVFDVESTKRGIGTFQKSYKMDRTRRLDRQTLLKLHSVTAKAAAGEGGWGVQKAVKSTVAEIGGKRGELMIGMVGRDKGNIGDVETLDFEQFVAQAHGERAKWLWHGKPKRAAPDHNDHAMGDMGSLLFGKEVKEDQQVSARRASSMPVEDEVESRKKEESPFGVYALPPPGSSVSVFETSPGDKEAVRRNVFKSVAGRVSDARSGLGRIRDAVGGGLKGHASRPSRDETGPTTAHLAGTGTSTSMSSPVSGSRTFAWKNKTEPHRRGQKKEDRQPKQTSRNTSDNETCLPITALPDAMQLSEDVQMPQEKALEREKEKSADSQAAEMRREAVLTGYQSSVAGSVIDENEVPCALAAAERVAGITARHLQRRHSISTPSAMQAPSLNDARFPRRLSFSDAEEAVLHWSDNLTDMLDTEAGSELACALHARLAWLRDVAAPWTESKLAGVEALDAAFGAQQAELRALYWALSEAQARAKHGGDELAAEERARVAEMVKDVETAAAKLEYETAALASRVRELEDGVAVFEGQVDDVERRADELRLVLEKESWLHWFFRTVTGIGTGPNITRGDGVALGAGQRT